MLALVTIPPPIESQRSSKRKIKRDYYITNNSSTYFYKMSCRVNQFNAGYQNLENITFKNKRSSYS